VNAEGEEVPKAELVLKAARLLLACDFACRLLMIKGYRKIDLEGERVRKVVK